MLCSFDGLDPPGIAGELEQHRRLLPELLEFVNEHVLQLVERREHGIGKVFAQMPENLLSWVQFRTVGGQGERMHACWPLHLSTAMTARAIQHDPDRTLPQLVPQILQEALQASAFPRRRQPKDPWAARGF